MPVWNRQTVWKCKQGDACSLSLFAWMEGIFPPNVCFEWFVRGVGLQIPDPFRIDNVIIWNMDDCPDRMEFSPYPADSPAGYPDEKRQEKQAPDSHDGGLNCPAKKDIESVHIASQKA